MSDKQEQARSYKKEIKFQASIGDWTKYKPEKPASKKVKPVFYGFNIISKPDLDKILTIHHFFAIEFSKYLRSSLKASIDIHSISIEQVSYLEFLKNVTEGLFYCKLNISNVGDAMLLIDSQLANTIINFSLGFQSMETKNEEPTDIEESMIKSVFDNSLNKYADCWGKTFEKPNFEIISYPNIQREAYINLNEVVTVISVQISIANSTPSTYTFVYQNSILKKLNELYDKKHEKPTLNFNSLPKELLNSLEIPVIAELGSTFIPAKELSQIEEDDLVSLEQKINLPIKIYISNVSRHYAQAGTRTGHYAVKVLENSENILGETFGPAPSKETEVPPPQEEKGMDVMGPEVKPEEILPADKTLEDFELPLEEEAKESYNEDEENLFNEEEKLGGN